MSATPPDDLAEPLRGFLTFGSGGQALLELPAGTLAVRAVTAAAQGALHELISTSASLGHRVVEVQGRVQRHQPGLPVFLLTSLTVVAAPVAARNVVRESAGYFATLGDVRVPLKAMTVEALAMLERVVGAPKGSSSVAIGTLLDSCFEVWSASTAVRWG